MLIKVTEEDIKNGVRHLCQKCPVSLAIKRAIKKDDVVVAGSRTRKQLPDKVIKLIALYDQGYSISPFEFEINL